MPAKTALITALIVGRPLCVDCIALRATVSVTEVYAYLDTIGTYLTVQHHENDRCRTCGAPGKTYFVGAMD